MRNDSSDALEGLAVSIILWYQAKGMSYRTLEEINLNTKLLKVRRCILVVPQLDRDTFEEA